MKKAKVLSDGNYDSNDMQNKKQRKRKEVIYYDKEIKQ